MNDRELKLFMHQFPLCFITGSTAINETTDQSDLDLVVLYEDKAMTSLAEAGWYHNSGSTYSNTGEYGINFTVFNNNKYPKVDLIIAENSIDYIAWKWATATSYGYKTKFRRARHYASTFRNIRKHVRPITRLKEALRSIATKYNTYKKGLK